MLVGIAGVVKNIWVTSGLVFHMIIVGSLDVSVSVILQVYCETQSKIS